MSDEPRFAPVTEPAGEREEQIAEHAAKKVYHLQAADEVAGGAVIDVPGQPPVAPKLPPNLQRQIKIAALMRMAQGPGDTDQVGTLMLATILAFREYLAKHNVKDRGPRHRAMRGLVADFEKRVKKYAVAPDPDPEPPSAQAVEAIESR